MKTLDEVKHEISLLMESNPNDMTKKKLSFVKSRLQFMRIIQMYLEKNPTEEFITKEIARIEDKINKRYSEFNEADYKDPREARKKHEKKMGIPELRSQLSALRFIKN